jgi:molybdopterin-guanine dinucleotide biosynthesis protein B
MIPIVSIVGKSDSGKTTLIERLIPEIKRRGYRIATVKHDTHSFEIDREGKDSYQPKIEVFRKEAHGEPLCKKDDNLVAFVSDVPFDKGVPCFNLNDIKGIADFIEERYLRR